MKTRNNIQKTVLGQVKKNTLYGIALLFSATFIFTTITAGNLTHQNAFNSNKCILCQNLSGTETNQTDAGFEFLEYRAQVFVDAEMEYEFENGLNNYAETNLSVIEVELSLHIEGYNSNHLVEAEMVSETEKFMNSYYEAIETELILHAEAYNANDFAEAELSAETENFKNSNNVAFEAELAFQAAGYNAKDFFEAELTAETENFMNGINETSDVELAFQVEIYDAKNFADAEIALEIESWIIMQHTSKSIETIASIE